ncbi:hypothetical protein Dimus_002366 [Dionaea muscipula]
MYLFYGLKNKGCILDKLQHVLVWSNMLHVCFKYKSEISFFFLQKMPLTLVQNYKIITPAHFFIRGQPSSSHIAHIIKTKSKFLSTPPFSLLLYSLSAKLSSGSHESQEWKEILFKICKFVQNRKFINLYNL